MFRRFWENLNYRCISSRYLPRKITISHHFNLPPSLSMEFPKKIYHLVAIVQENLGKIPRMYLVVVFMFRSMEAAQVAARIETHFRLETFFFYLYRNTIVT